MGFWEGYSLDQIAKQNQELLNELRKKLQFESTYYKLKEQNTKLIKQRAQMLKALSDDRSNRLGKL